MTQPAADERDQPHRLSWKCWLWLVVVMPLIGSAIAFAGLLAHQLYVVGNVAALFSSSAGFPPILDQLKFVVLVSVATNLCGAVSLIAIIAIRDRLRRF